jgi:hypothetical protein
MRAALVLAVLGLASPADAHCFSRWRYPWPQHCSVSHEIRAPARVVPVVARVPDTRLAAAAALPVPQLEDAARRQAIDALRRELEARVRQ